jgi:Ca-activated chloride channel homolog
VNLLSFRESANEDGFFLLLMQPPLDVDADAVIPKDVIIVLDQSGSMDGAKWEQAQAAASYVLSNLNPRDRFNVVIFSTGVRVYGSGMQSPDQAADAKDWIDGLFAEGGTNIDLALTTALEMADR